jgi:two-component system phosphate regulon response regulator OmpR
VPPEPGTRVLICDDEPDIRDLFADYLALRGFEVATAADACGLRAGLAGGGVDVVLLDINLPGEDGLTALRDLRGAGDSVPVLLLTSRAEVVDRIVGIEMGADDYLPKPVDLRELEARIKAVLRRAGAAAGRDPAVRGDRWRFGKCWLDVAAATLLAEDGSEVPLTAMEFNLLKLFADNRGRVLNRDQILEGAHDRAWDPFDRSIDIRISRIRRKVEVNPEKPLAIRTVRGLGYIYDPK